jgi:nucleotide-binding universal stress UspA family protein
MDESWRVTLRERLLQRMMDLREQVGGDGEVLVETGTPHEVVANIAARREAGLVVIGRSSPSGVLGRLRTHSYSIIRRSPCPVLSV